MEIINATWDKKNLGIDTYEIRLSINDIENMDQVINELKNKKYINSYVVIKMPVSNIKALHILEDEGFRFIETQFHMKKNLKNYTTPDFLKKIKKILKQREIERTAKEWQKIANKISENMFHTDRIYLDPKLNNNASCIRYRNWIMNFINNENAHLFVYSYENDDIGFGFVTMDPKTKIVDDILEGIFTEYQNFGYGFTMFDLALDSYANKYGMNQLTTSISSNNVSIMKLDLIFGYNIQNSEYILRKFY